MVCLGETRNESHEIIMYTVIRRDGVWRMRLTTAAAAATQHARIHKIRTMTPIDGTTSYAACLPASCVTLAVGGSNSCKMLNADIATEIVASDGAAASLAGEGQCAARLDPARPGPK